MNHHMRVIHTSPVDGPRSFTVSERVCAQSRYLTLLRNEGLSCVCIPSVARARMAPYLYQFAEEHVLRYDERDPFHMDRNTLPCVFVPEHHQHMMRESSRKEIGNLMNLSNADLFDLVELASFMGFRNVAHVARLIHIGRSIPLRNCAEKHNNVLLPYGHKTGPDGHTIEVMPPPQKWSFRHTDASCM